MSAFNTIGYRCPKCKNAWNSYTKDYNGFVYCTNKKCSHKFENKQQKISCYRFYETTNNKKEMIDKIKDFLKELEEFDERYD